MTVCVYHSDCPDGFTAAWICHASLEDVTLHAGRYGEPPPEARGEDVYIVDFSYPRDQLAALCERAYQVTVFDHHQTAEADLHDFEAPNARIVFDMARSGAAITWDELVGGRARAPLVDYVQDRDLWRFALDGTAEVFAAMTSRPFTLAAWDEMDAMTIEALRVEGRAIERFRQQAIETAVDNAVEVDIAGHRVLAANVIYSLGSDVAGRLAEGADFGAYWFDTPGWRRWGLRSREGGLDVSAVAQAFGGGGHRHAAGFRVPLDPMVVYPG